MLDPFAHAGPRHQRLKGRKKKAPRPRVDPEDLVGDLTFRPPPLLPFPLRVPLPYAPAPKLPPPPPGPFSLP